MIGEKVRKREILRKTVEREMAERHYKREMVSGISLEKSIKRLYLFGFISNINSDYLKYVHHIKRMRFCRKLKLLD